MRGAKPTPTALRRANGNPGKRGYNAQEPTPEQNLPNCPPHLNDAGREEWHRLAAEMNALGILTRIDRAAFAAYCQCYGRWVEAEDKLAETPMLFKTKTGYVQQSPWLSIANKQLELMGRYAAEFGMTPASRPRVVVPESQIESEPAIIELTFVPAKFEWDRDRVDRPPSGTHSRDYDRANRITRCESAYEAEAD